MKRSTQVLIASLVLLGVLAAYQFLNMAAPAEISPKVTVVKTTRLAQTSTGSIEEVKRPPTIQVETCTEQLTREIASVREQQAEILKQLKYLRELGEQALRGNVQMQYKLEEFKNGQPKKR